MSLPPDTSAQDKKFLLDLPPTVLKKMQTNEYFPLKNSRPQTTFDTEEPMNKLTMGQGGSLQFKVSRSIPEISSQEDFLECLSHFATVSMLLGLPTARDNVKGLSEVNRLLRTYHWRKIHEYVEAIRVSRSRTSMGFGGHDDTHSRMGLKFDLLVNKQFRDDSRDEYRDSGPDNPSPKKKAKLKIKKAGDVLTQAEVQKCKAKVACLAFNRGHCSQSGSHSYTRNGPPKTLLHQCGICGSTQHGINSSPPCPNR
jgi:hypothetical protein